MRRWIAYSLVLIGIVILAYPKASEWYNDKQQEKLMAQWEIGETNEEAGQTALEQYGGLTTLFEELDAEDTELPSQRIRPPRANHHRRRYLPKAR